MHYYQFNIGDYRKDTIHLSPIEHYIYRSLLDTYYLTEKPLSNDIDHLMRTHCLRTADEKQSLCNVLADFFVIDDVGYRHKRCDVELIAFHDKSESASRSAKARWEKDRCNGNANALAMQSERNANALETQSDGNANHKPLTINQEPITTLSESDNSRVVSFEKFWKAYPKKSGKGAAETAWKKIKKPSETVELMLDALEWQRKSPQWLKDAGQFIPNPATYLNQRRWEDQNESHEVTDQMSKEEKTRIWMMKMNGMAK